MMGQWFIKKLVQTRNKFSRLLNNHRNTADWRPAFSSLVQFEQWMLNHFVYKHDFLGGIVDNTKSVGYMFWQYKNKGGVVKGDCDDSATLYVWALNELRKDVSTSIVNIWRVNIPKYRHVICVWSYMLDSEAQFGYSSGTYLFYHTALEDKGHGWESIREVVDAYGRRTKRKKLGANYYPEPVSGIVL